MSCDFPGCPLEPEHADVATIAESVGIELRGGALAAVIAASSPGTSWVV